MNKNENDLDVLNQLSIQDFLNVGLDQVAYIKHLKNDQDKHDIYTIHAADGSQISVMDSYATALAAIKVNDLYAVTVH